MQLGYRPLPATAISALVGVVLCLVQPAATAHPFGDEYYAHRLVLRLHDTSIDLEYSTEIPAQEIMLQFARKYAGVAEVGSAQDEEFADARLAELGEGLVVILGDDLVDVDWQPMPDVPNGVGNGRFFVYHIRGTIPHTFTEDPTNILVTNDNNIKEVAYFSGWIFADPGIRVLTSSLEGMGAAASGKDVFQQEGAWSRDPIYRDIAATMAMGTPPGEGTEQGEGTDDKSAPFPIWILGILLALVGAVVGVKLLLGRSAHGN